MKYASLCILSYERPDFLIQSFRSLIKNTTYPHERIMHDDGSKNMSLLNYYTMIEDKHLSYMVANKGKNRGIAVAMHNCIKVATGDYIAKLDADMEYLPGWLETITRILENNPDVAICGLFDYRHYDMADTRFEHLEERVDCFIVNDFVNSGYVFSREIYEEYGKGMGDDGWQQYIRNEAGKHCDSRPRLLAIPKVDVAVNKGFGAENSIYIQNDKAVEFHKLPKLFP